MANVNDPSESVLKSAARSVEAWRRIRDHIVYTPVLKSRTNSTSDGQLWYKAENFQETGSFKLRGATSKLSSLSCDVPVITASSGNHGIACAKAALATGHDLSVVVPENVVHEKLAAIQNLGSKVILHGTEPGAAETHAQKLAESGDYVYVSPYNDPQVIAGQGTVALELLEQIPHIDRVFVSMGGGGLIAGIGSVFKAFSPATEIIGVSAQNTAALAASMKAGKIVEIEHFETLADGVAGGVDANSITLPLALEVIDRVIHCSEDDIIQALISLAWEEKLLVEGAAALALAAYNCDQKSYEDQVNVVLLCGGNFDSKKN